MRACRLFGCGLVLLVSTLLAALSSGGVAEASREACRAAAQALRGALASGDVAAARRHYDTVWEEPGCDDALREQAGRAVSLLHARVAQERVAAGARLANQRAFLERGLGYARSWPLLALLADLAHDEQDFDGAAVLYQEALTVLDDSVETPQSPPQSEIERLVRRAEQSRLLAVDYQPSPKTRAGNPGGLAATHVRGFAIEQVAVPITFQTDSADFTDKGVRAAADLASHLMAQGPARIAIAGHTDPRGSEAYNLELSQRRAEAVSQYLRAQGFAGEVEVIAKGESERFQVDDPSLYTESQRWQMDRRVELIR